MSEPKIVYFFYRRSKCPDLEKAAVVKKTPTGYRIQMGHNQTTVISDNHCLIFTSFEEARAVILDRYALGWKEAKDRVALMQKRTREIEALQEEKFPFTWNESLNG
jgi:hypothetical protein